MKQSILGFHKAKVVISSCKTNITSWRLGLSQELCKPPKTSVKIKVGRGGGQGILFAALIAMNQKFCSLPRAAARVGYNPNTILENLNNQLRTHAFPISLSIMAETVLSAAARFRVVSTKCFFRFSRRSAPFPDLNRKKDTSFHHLHGYGAFLVSAELRSGRIQEISLMSEKGQICSISLSLERGTGDHRKRLSLPRSNRHSTTRCILPYQNRGELSDLEKCLPPVFHKPLFKRYGNPGVPAYMHL